MKNEFERFPTIAKLTEQNQSTYFLENLSKVDLFNKIILLEGRIEELTSRINQLEKGVKSEVSIEEKYSDIQVAEKTEIMISQISVGDFITFGNYGGEEISWKVLDVKDGKAFLLSQYAIDSKPYNNVKKDIDWDKCSLRTWLNNDFKGKAFSSADLSRINGEVALLSVEEAVKYLPTWEERECQATSFAKDNGVSVWDNGKVWWWLKDKGSDWGCACCVFSNGDIYERGLYVGTRSIGVRPALWINL